MFFGSAPMGECREQNCKTGKLGCDVVLAEASADPMGSSGTGIALQIGSEFLKGVKFLWSLIYQSLDVGCPHILDQRSLLLRVMLRRRIPVTGHQPSTLQAASGINILSIKMVQDWCVCGGAVHQSNYYISECDSFSPPNFCIVRKSICNVFSPFCLTKLSRPDLSVLVQVYIFNKVPPYYSSLCRFLLAIAL